MCKYSLRSQDVFLPSVLRAHTEIGNNAFRCAALLKTDPNEQLQSSFYLTYKLIIQNVIICHHLGIFIYS